MTRWGAYRDLLTLPLMSGVIATKSPAQARGRGSTLILRFKQLQRGVLENSGVSLSSVLFSFNWFVDFSGYLMSLDGWMDGSGVRID